MNTYLLQHYIKIVGSVQSYTLSPTQGEVEEVRGAGGGGGVSASAGLAGGPRGRGGPGPGGQEEEREEPPRPGCC